MDVTGQMPLVPGGYNGVNNGLGGIGLVGLIGMNSLFGAGAYGLGTPGAAAAAVLPSNIVEQTLGHLRKDISDAALEACKVEGRIQSAIQVQDANNQVNFRALDKNICDTHMALHNNIDEARKEAIIAGKDAQIRSLEVEARTDKRLTDFERNIDTQFCDVKKDIMGVNFNMEKMNTHLTHVMDKGFAATMLETERRTAAIALQAERDTASIKLEIERRFAHEREEELEEKIDDLRAAKRSLEQNAGFAAQFGLVNQALQSIANQTQHLTNQVVQFGAGNTAIPVATNNQVK